MSVVGTPYSLLEIQGMKGLLDYQCFVGRMVSGAVMSATADMAAIVLHDSVTMVL